MEQRDGLSPPLHPMLAALALDTATRPLDPFPGVYLVQVAADLAACLLLMHVTRRRFGPRAGLCAGWLYALQPSAVLWSASTVAVEPLSALVLAGALVAQQRVQARWDRRPWLAALTLGALCGVGLLVREEMLLLTAVFTASLLSAPGASPSRRLGFAAMVLGTALAVTTPWAESNRTHHGKAVLSGTTTTFAALVDNAPPGENGELIWAAAPDLRGKVTAARRVLLRSWSEYPGLTAQRAGRRLLVLVGPETTLPGAAAEGIDGAPTARRASVDVLRDRWRLPSGSAGRMLQLLLGIAMLGLLSLSAAGWSVAPLDMGGRTVLMAGLTLALAAALTVSGDRLRFLAVPLAVPYAALALDMLTQREPLLPRSARRAAVAGLVVAALLALTLFLLPAP